MLLRNSRDKSSDGHVEVRGEQGARQTWWPVPDLRWTGNIRVSSKRCYISDRRICSYSGGIYHIERQPIELRQNSLRLTWIYTYD